MNTQIIDHCLQSLGRIDRHEDLHKWKTETFTQSTGRFIRKDENDKCPLIVAFPGAGKTLEMMKAMIEQSNEKCMICNSKIV